MTISVTSSVSEPRVPSLEDVLPPNQLLGVLRSMRRGNFDVGLPREYTGVAGEIAKELNMVIELHQGLASELERIGKVVGKEGNVTKRAVRANTTGSWAKCIDSVNELIDDLVQPITEMSRVIGEVASGNLSQSMAIHVSGRPLEGQFLHTAHVVNGMVQLLGSFAGEVARVVREVGTDGKLGGQANVAGVAGTWKDLTDKVNLMAGNLTAQVRNIADVTTAVAKGDLSKKITVDANGEIRQLKDTTNTMVDQLNSFAKEVTRVAREVGTEGRLGGRADVEGVAGTWKDLTESVNSMASNLTAQVRNIAEVTTAVARGDLSKKITVDVRGELLELKNTINTMVDQLNAFANEVTRVAREVGTEGKLGGQAEVPGVSGTWEDLTDSVNSMASNLTDQVRNIAEVTTAIARGDLSKKIAVNVRGEILELKNTINTVVDQLNAFAGEVTRVAREVGTDGRLGGQAYVTGVAGTWKDLTDSVNSMASNLTNQVRNIALVTTAVARGDLSKKITVDVKGEILELKDTINTMVDQLNAFASEVTRVAREVGTEGKLGGQARVPGAAGTWKDLTDSVNSMATNLTNQVRGIARVVTAVARGDLNKKLALEASGEIKELAETINGMTDTLAIFSEQVVTVAREVGVEGKLGGQAKVPGAAGTWHDLTDNVNQLAANLTTQVRAIGDVATAVTNGDLTRHVTVEVSGEVAALKDNINKMIRNLKETTQKTTEQDWLKTHLARFTRMLQGQRDLETVAQRILSELAPLVGAHQGLFYITEVDAEGRPRLKLLATYAAGEDVATGFRFGQGLIGQCATEKRKILLDDVPDDYIRVGSGLGGARPSTVACLPVLFDANVNAAIELACLGRLSDIHQVFLDQLTESIGVVINTIGASMRTEALLKQSQLLTHELQSQQEELRQTNERLQHQAATLRESEERLRLQQDQLRGTNEQLEEKAKLLEVKNQEVEYAKEDLEEKAEQLALTSRYKSQFLANMSHELRTPLNSLLILSKLLSGNPEGNLTTGQVEALQTIHASGTDLLELINDVLDLSKIESGTIAIEPAEVLLEDLQTYVKQSFRHVAQEKGLGFSVELAPGLPVAIFTDAKRLQQVLRNLLSNAFKFTDDGGVGLEIKSVPFGWTRTHDGLNETDTVIAFSVKDTGMGIPENKQRIIFEAFQQADGTTSRRYGGTGLGLSISREIAGLLGGEIRVVSRPGVGSTFTLFLPRHQVPRPASLLTEGTAVVEQMEPISTQRRTLDDRDWIRPGDQAILILHTDASLLKTMSDAARGQGFKVISGADVSPAVALGKFNVAGVVLDLQSPESDGWAVLDWLKHQPTSRHVAVVVCSAPEHRQRALEMGAQSFVESPGSPEAARDAMLECKRRQTAGEQVLVVGDEGPLRQSVKALVAREGIEVVDASTEEGPRRLSEGPWECVVLAQGSAELGELDWLDPASTDLHVPRLVVYSERELGAGERASLAQLSEAWIQYEARSPLEALEQVSRFLDMPLDDAPEPQRRTLEDVLRQASVLDGATIVVLDDDVRNIFAMTSVLEHHGANVVFAENGGEGLEILSSTPHVDAVLLDIMMPDMDGFAVLRHIRSQNRYRDLPVFAVTAKAMRSDRTKCMQAGATGYVSKPVDVQHLLSLLRVWIAR